MVSLEAMASAPPRADLGSPQEGRDWLGPAQQGGRSQLWRDTRAVVIPWSLTLMAKNFPKAWPEPTVPWEPDHIISHMHKQA